MKLLIWTTIPTHHQSALFAALRRNHDLRVNYINRVPAARARLGWASPDKLPQGERYVLQSLESLKSVDDWGERVHVLSGTLNLFCFRLAVYLSLRNAGWVHWSEPFRPLDRHASIRTLARRLYVALVNRSALGALAIGEMAKRDFIHWGIRPEKVSICPYSIEHANVIGADDNGREHGLRVLFLGAMCARKGVDVLLRAMQILSQKWPRSRLRIVGSDERGGFYQDLAIQLGLGDSVEFLPPVPAAEIGRPLSWCDVLVLPSRFDGWGMVLCEAASAGKAVIGTTQCGAAYHVIDHGTAGFRIPPNDPFSLAEALEVYASDRRVLLAHGGRSKELFEQLLPRHVAPRMTESIVNFRQAQR